jgi:hypothetical protein
MGDASKTTIAIDSCCRVYGYMCLNHLLEVHNLCLQIQLQKLLLLGMWMCLQLAIAGDIVTSTNTKLQLLPGKLGSIQTSIAVWPQLELSS